MYKECRECKGKVKGWQYCLIGYCKRCYGEFFPERENRLPPLRRKIKGGWQRLLNQSKRARWEKPFDDVIDKIDRENSNHRERRDILCELSGK